MTIGRGQEVRGEMVDRSVYLIEEASQARQPRVVTVFGLGYLLGGIRHSRRRENTGPENESSQNEKGLP